MLLKHRGYIDLPAHTKAGGYDHAAIHRARARLYIAHTANDGLDVVNCASDRYLHTISNLTGVAGALASDERDLVFTSNRGENTVGIFSPDDEGDLVKVAVGVRPNGLSYDPTRNLLLAANVGDPAAPDSLTVSIVDVATQSMVASVPMPGRTRWTVFDPQAQAFYVNISEPAQIVIIDAHRPTHIARILNVPVAGPHGLDLDAGQRRLYCACDGKRLVTLGVSTGEVLDEQRLCGVPDEIFFNAARKHLYVAIGDPGVIEVFDTEAISRVGTAAWIETVPTEKGAHTIAFDAERNKVYAFLPQTHRASVYADGS